MSSSSVNDISRARVQNGYGIKTSMMSITNVGSGIRPPTQVTPAQYKKEAITISNQVKRMHGPAIASLHLQKNFPETRRLMQPPYGRLSEQKTPRELKNISFPPQNHLTKTKWEKNDIKPFAETNPKWSNDIKEAHAFGSGHRNGLAHRSHKTNVNLIISQQDRNGQPFKAGSDLLFPQNASHMQLLCLTKQVAAPDARVKPVIPEPRPVWRGMDKGWSNFD